MNKPISNYSLAEAYHPSHLVEKKIQVDIRAHTPPHIDP